MPNNPNLVSTKLKMPSPRRNFVRREALFDKLDGVAEHRITIVRGAAGSGKTTLLASYIRERAAIPFKWLTLDRETDDIRAFWRYLSEAVADTPGGAGRDAALFASAMNREDIGGLLQALINALGDAGELAVVLDDFHTVSGAGLLETIEYFIKNSPENVHFVLATREEPPLYIGDVAVSGGLLNIGEEDLRFDEGESEAFLKDTLGLAVSEDALRSMSLQAEGWVGGLQLLALASSGTNAAAVRGIRSLGRYAVEYLQREILNSLPGELQAFMIKTSALASFDEGICERLFGRDSAGFIQALLDRNLFVTHMGGDSPSYRYHNMFGEFLRLRFDALEGEEKRRFREDAARWYEEQGDCEESIRHLLAAEDYESAMKLIKRESANYRLWSFLTEIPLERLGADRELVIERLFFVYYNEGADKLISLFNRYKDEMERDEYWRVLKIAKAVLLDMDFRVDPMTAEEIDAMELGPVAKSILCLKTAVFLFMKFELQEALAILDKADALQAGSGNPFIQMSVLSIKSGVKEELGDLAECEKLYDRIFAMMREHRLMEQLMFNFYVGITGVYLKTGRLEQAEAALGSAVKTAGRTDIWADGGYLYNMMELRLLQGRAGEAYGLMEKLLGLDFYQNMLYASGLIKYLDCMGRLSDELAGRYARAYEGCENRFLRVEDNLAFMRVLHFAGRDAEALELADGVLEKLRSRRIGVKLIEALLFKHGLLPGDTPQAQRERQDLLREAVYYATANRIFSPFLLAGPGFAKPLLQLMEQKGRDLSSAEKLFAGETATRLGGMKLDGLLSERELEVLRHLATGAANKEIAERLFISLSTVKTHIISIYSKLQAGNRLEAVEKARELEILPTGTPFPQEGQNAEARRLWQAPDDR